MPHSIIQNSKRMMWNGSSRRWIVTFGFIRQGCIQTHSISSLHIVIAANNSYFSAASASAARTGKSRIPKSGCGCRDINCSKRSRTSDVSGRSTKSSRGDSDVLNFAAPEKAAEWDSNCFLQNLNITPSQDLSMMSESGLQTIGGVNLRLSRRFVKQDLHLGETLGSICCESPARIESLAIIRRLVVSCETCHWHPYKWARFRMIPHNTTHVLKPWNTRIVPRFGGSTRHFEDQGCTDHVISS
jgi:hypothetical protein